MVGNQIKFDDQIVARFLTNIYKQRFNIDSDIEAEMFRATRRIMADAMATGIADAVDNGTPMPSETFLNNLRHSAEVFSAFRVHKMQTDVASQMVDANGKLKTFAQFRKDVEPYVSHRNRAWLRTEYDTAVIRAHQATDWQQFESEKDVFPNLEWIPSTSPHPGADHQVFWGTVRPVNDSFWSEHRPGDRWNCKCELRQTEADATIPPMPTDADNPQPGLENNPGRDGELFSQKHPYYPSGCMSCPFAGGHLAALMHGLAHKQNCHQCEKVNKVIDQHVETQRSRNRKEYDRLKKDSNYTEVRFDKKNGGVSAIHKEHNFDTEIGLYGIARGEYERNTLNALYQNGYSVILRGEQGEIGIKQPDGYLNGRLMDIKGIENGNPLYALNRANLQQVEVAILYFHDKNKFDSNSIYEKWKDLPSWVSDNRYIADKTIYIKDVICVVNGDSGYEIHKIKKPEE